MRINAAPLRQNAKLIALSANADSINKFGQRRFVHTNDLVGDIYGLDLMAGAIVDRFAFPPVVIAGFLSFGLMALLYLVTEELLVEAHEKPDTPRISAMFFIGFLGLLLIEELLG